MRVVYPAVCVHSYLIINVNITHYTSSGVLHQLAESLCVCILTFIIIVKISSSSGGLHQSAESLCVCVSLLL